MVPARNIQYIPVGVRRGAVRPAAAAAVAQRRGAVAERPGAVVAALFWTLPAQALDKA